jgi:hypothetical protein
MASSTSLLEQLDLDFSNANVRDWAYSAPEKGLLPYSKGTNYFSRGLSVTELAERNMDEARSVGFSETDLSLTRNGLWVGLVYWEPGQKPGEDELTRPKFEKPVPMDEAIAGDQPPITGLYPRVVFPPEGEFRYALLVNYDEGIFGTGFENHTLEIPGGTAPYSVDVPDDIKYEKAVQAALNEFLSQYFEDQYFLPSGEYTLNMEIEKMPCLAVRIDGYKPLHSKLRYEGDVKLELPIAEGFDYAKMMASPFSKRTPRKNPFQRRVSTEKYVEMPFGLPSDDHGQWFSLATTSLEYQSQEDKADLVYVALRRSESIAETETNPHLGLVEIQISRVAQVRNVEVSYKPKEVKKPENPLENLDHTVLYSLGSDRGPTRSMGFKGEPTRSFSSSPVNTGKTVLANARTGPVSPKVEVEWDDHLQTFRFCLTNHP